MKWIKIVESVLLLGILAFIAGCNDCGDVVDDIVYGSEHTYVYCVKDPKSPSGYSPMYGDFHERVAPMNAVPFGDPNKLECGPSVNGQAPLPHPKTTQTVPPSGPKPPGSADHVNTAVSNVVAIPAYVNAGMNNGFIPPGQAIPGLPVPPGGPPPGTVPGVTCPTPSADVVVVNHLNGTLTRLGTCPFSTKAVIPLVSRPLQVEVTPDGTLALVTNFDNAISFVDLATNKVAFNLVTGQNVNPTGIALSPDGVLAYVTSFNAFNPAVLVIDIASRKILNTIPVSEYPQAAFITPDGAQLYVTHPLDDVVTIVDTLTNSVAMRLSIRAPFGIGFNPTGTRAYIASASGTPGQVIALDTATLKPAATYNVGSSPLDVKVVNDGRSVLVTNFLSGSISAIDTISGEVLTSSNGTTAMGLALVH